MSGRFVRSRSPPQPKTVMTRRGPQLAHGLQQVLERVVGVRVVDDHREAWPRRPPAPGGRARPSRWPGPRSGDVGSDAQRPRGARRRPAGSATLKRPTSGALHLERARRAVHAEARAVQGQADVLGAEVRRPARCRRSRRAPARRRASVGRAVVVGVDDGASVRPQERRSKSFRLACEVRVHVAVEVEVVAGEVREDGHLERAAVHALQPERVRRDLQHGVRQPASTISRNRACRSEASGVVRAASARRSPMRYCDACPAGRPVSGRAQRGVDEVGGGGLAVGAGDAHERRARSRARPARRRRGGRGPRARPGTCSQGTPGRRRLLGGDGGRALLARRLHELVAVGGEAA